MRPLFVLAILAATVLAGCSDGPQVEEDDVFDDQPDAVSQGKGVIRGIVVDPAVIPVIDAQVRLRSTGEETTTDENGAFFLADVEPGLQSVEIWKVGWSRVQQSVDVQADVARPPIVKVMLERQPGTEPRALTVAVEGFIQCGAGTPLTFHVCPVYDDQDRSTVTVPFEGAPDWIQVETTWESTQVVSEQLYLVYYFCTDDCSARSNRWSEGNVDDPWIDRTAGGNRTAMQQAIYASPGGPANGTGFSIDQQFFSYVTFFYNIAEPDPDWAFIHDGDYQV